MHPRISMYANFCHVPFSYAHIHACSVCLRVCVCPCRIKEMTRASLSQCIAFGAELTFALMHSVE